MKTFMTFLLALCVIVALLAAVFFALGPKTIWTKMIGDVDSGPIELSSLRRAGEPNDALACTIGMCDRVNVNLELPAYDMTPAALISAIEARAKQINPDVVRLDDGSSASSARFVTYSPIMKFPDMTWIETIDLQGNKTGLRVYAKARLGYSDLGANLKRLTAWTENLEDGS